MYNYFLSPTICTETLWSLLMCFSSVDSSEREVSRISKSLLVARDSEKRLRRVTWKVGWLVQKGYISLFLSVSETRLPSSTFWGCL